MLAQTGDVHRWEVSADSLSSSPGGAWSGTVTERWGSGPGPGPEQEMGARAVFLKVPSSSALQGGAELLCSHRAWKAGVLHHHPRGSAGCLLPRTEIDPIWASDKAPSWQAQAEAGN